MSEPWSRRPWSRRLATSCAIATVPLLGATACGPGPVSPLPNYEASRAGQVPVGAPAVPTGGPTTRPVPGTSVTAAPTSSVRPPVRPATSATTSTRTEEPSTSSPTDPPPCRGVERYDLDLQNTELALMRPLCFRVGSLIHVHSIGPGQVTAEPSTVAEADYEAGTVDVRLVGPGTATMTISQNGQVYPITVVVVS